MNRLALAAAKRLRDTSPRADYTINQLPLLAVPATTDQIPVFHNGQTYQSPVSALTGPPGPPGVPSILINTDFSALHIYNVGKYGALGNGSTDDTIAIQAAITAAVADPFGGEVYFPGGTYLITSGLTVTGPCSFAGNPGNPAGSNTLGSMIVTNTTQTFNAITVTNVGAGGSGGFVMRDLTIKYLSGSAPSVNAIGVKCISAGGSGNSVGTFTNVNVVNFSSGFLFDGCGGILLTNCQVVTYPFASAQAFQHWGFRFAGEAGGNANLAACVNCTVNGLQTASAANAADGFVLSSGYATLQLYNCTVLKANRSYWSTSQKYGGGTGSVPTYLQMVGCTDEISEYGILIDQNGSLVQISQHLTDSGQDTSVGWQFSSTFTGLGQITNSIIEASDGGLYVLGGANVGISNCIFQNIGPAANNDYLRIGAVAIIDVSNCSFIATGGLSANVNGVHFLAAFAGAATITGCVQAGGSQMTYGLLIDAGAGGRLTVAGSDFSGNATANFQDNSLSGSSPPVTTMTKSFEAVQGVMPFFVPTQPYLGTVPSGTTITNIYPCAMMIYVNSANSIAHAFINGTDILGGTVSLANQTPLTFIVPRGAQMQIVTSGGAATMGWFPVG